MIIQLRPATTIGAARDEMDGITERCRLGSVSARRKLRQRTPLLPIRIACLHLAVTCLLGLTLAPNTTTLDLKTAVAMPARWVGSV